MELVANKKIQTSTGGRYDKGTSSVGLQTGKLVQGIPSVPLIVSDQATFGCRTSALREFGHTELDVWLGVEWRGIEYSDTVPTRLHLIRQVILEAA